MRTLVTAPAGTRDAVNFLDVRLCCIAPRPDNGRPRTRRNSPSR